MSLLGNIIWLIFGGFLAGIGYILGGLLVCVTIIGIPFGQQAILTFPVKSENDGRIRVSDSSPFSISWI